MAVRIAGAGASPQAIDALPLRSADGVVVPLSAIAKPRMDSGRSEIDHEDGLRRQVVTANPTTSDQTGFAATARWAIAAQVSLPPGVCLRYGGVAEEQVAAAHQLYLHAAAALALIVLLITLPSTLIGGVAASGGALAGARRRPFLIGGDAAGTRSRPMSDSGHSIGAGSRGRSRCAPDASPSGSGLSPSPGQTSGFHR